MRRSHKQLSSYLKRKESADKLKKSDESKSEEQPDQKLPGQTESIIIPYTAAQRKKLQKARLTLRFSKIITALVHEIDILKDANMIEIRSQIVEFFKENKIDYDYLVDVELADLVDEVSSCCKDKVDKVKLSQVIKSIKERYAEESYEYVIYVHRHTNMHIQERSILRILSNH